MATKRGGRASEISECCGKSTAGSIKSHHELEKIKAKDDQLESIYFRARVSEFIPDSL
jgi:hypothetical protein